MPGEMRVSRTAVAEDAQVDDMRDAGISCRVGDGFRLVRHRDGVAGHHEQPIDALQRGPEGPRVTELQTNPGRPFVPPPPNRLCATRGPYPSIPLRDGI